MTTFPKLLVRVGIGIISLLTLYAVTLLILDASTLGKKPSFVGQYLNTEIRVLRDPNGKLSIDDILQPLMQSQFVTQNQLRFGYTEDAIWLRIEAPSRPDDDPDLLLEVEPASLDDIRFYSPDAAGHYSKAIYVGDRQLFANRQFDYRHYLFELPKANTHQSVVYLRLQNSQSLNPLVRLWTSTALRSPAQRELLLFGIFFGLLLATALTNIITGILMREDIYFSFAALTLIFVWALFNSSGLLAQFVFPNNPAIPDRLTGINFCLVTAGLLVVQRKPLRLIVHFPHVDRLLPWLAIGVLMLGSLNLIDAYGPVSPFVSWIMAFAAVLNLAAAWKEYGAKRPGASFWLVGTFIYVAALAFALIHVAGLNPWPHLANGSWRFGATALAAMMYAGVFRAMQVQRDARTDADAKVVLTQALVTQERRLFDEQTAFFSFVAHELRTPLTVIISGLTNLRADASDATVEVRDRVARVLAAAFRQNDLIDRHLRLQRLIRADFETDLAGCPSELAATQALDLIQQAHSGRRIDYLPAKNLPDYVDQDSELITLAVSNLLDNALKYSPPETVVRFELNYDATTEQLCYRVTDRGSGISPTDQARLFSIYVRAEGNSHAGFGIGLALVERVATHHHGKIHCESIEGEGTTFSLYIPIRATNSGIAA